MDEFIDSLEKRTRAKVFKWLSLLEEHGPALPRPHADILEESIRELRVGLGRVEARLLYFFHKRTIVVVTNGFLKKTRVVPRAEIERALRARRDWLNRHGGGT